VSDICRDIGRRVWIRAVDERGASLVEYSLLVALIAIVAFAAMVFFGESISSSVDDSGSKIINAGA